MNTANNKESVQQVKSVVKAINILDCFTPEKAELSLGEISAQLHLPKSTALNLLRTLETGGLIFRSPSSMNYQLGFKIMNLNYRMQMAMPVIRYSMSYLENLHLHTGKTVYLTTHINGQVFYLDAAYAMRSSLPYSSNGKILDMHCTGCGKAMMAYMPETELEHIIATHGLKKFTETTLVTREALFADLAQIRKRGYAIDNGEESLGVRCIAAPVLNEEGYPTAALSISGSTYAMQDTQIMEYIDPLMSAVRALSQNANEFPAGQIRAARKMT